MENRATARRIFRYFVSNSIVICSGVWMGVRNNSCGFARRTSPFLCRVHGSQFWGHGRNLRRLEHYGLHLTAKGFYELAQTVRPQKDIWPVVFSSVVSGALWGYAFGGSRRVAPAMTLFCTIGCVGYGANELFQGWRYRKGLELAGISLPVQRQSIADRVASALFYSVSEEEIERRIEAEVRRRGGV